MQVEVLDISQMTGKAVHEKKKMPRNSLRRATTALASGEPIEAKSAMVNPKIA